ncbi:hypothetical protein H1C71_024320 [Ictidomys tridecemlineatus]|uniref:leukocyte surface antigen CD47-like isoform X1 n=1 Tax=Ictidomys tridecemlineatus TaxID=43179 RepID=UPI001A9F69B1|nr:leukocyte surface antigen CD47-like isoform X1 [Ictidomys tridecemlineatus]KAG3271513.1 hypothetical protein H1C71_024320 [Ictidomys tridecemlineatus]
MSDAVEKNVQWPGGQMRMLEQDRRQSAKGSAQPQIQKVDSVDATNCNKSILIPCFALYSDIEHIKEAQVKWSLNDKLILHFIGAEMESKVDPKFSSAKVYPEQIINGNYSLEMATKDAAEGTYTCEIQEFYGSDASMVQLKLKQLPWFKHEEYNLITSFSILNILLFWGQFILLTR